MKISAQFATSLDSPEHIAAAEQLGYDRAWLFDTPHESPDVWMMLALAAERTTRIGLGPGVLVPTLRHPMVNASATAALAALAPGRVAVAFGTGFAGARALGAAPTSWSYLADYVRAFRGLLTGAIVQWQGTRMKMMHPVGHAPARPIDVPILISALGPKGLAVATELGDALPAGDVWLEAINQTPPQDRHLAVHDKHLIALNRADTAAWAAGSWKAVAQTTLTGTADDIGRRVSQIAAQGITEIIYQPTGPDIAAELEAFHTAARTVTPAG
jgi:5,10-methylenetetrahydromethanopterin reductase